MTTPAHHQKLVFLDVETTGMNPRYHEIIEVAIIGNDDEMEPFCTKLKPIHPERISDEAIAVNGYNEEEWDDAPKVMQMHGEITTRLHDRIVCGHHVGFDIDFVKHSCGEDTFRCRSIDTVTLAYAHLIPLGLSSLNLGTIAAFLGIDPTRSHRALEDAMTCRAVYREILRRVRERPTLVTPRKFDGVDRHQLEQIILDQDIALAEARK